MSNKFVYGGVSPAISNVMSTSGDGFVNFYVEVSVFWGDLVQTFGLLRPSMEAPSKLPVFPASLPSKIFVTRNPAGGGNAVADLTYVGRHEAFDGSGNYLGTKLLYTTGPIPTSDATSYKANWMMNGPITVNYGSDYVELMQQPGGASDAFAAGD